MVYHHHTDSCRAHSTVRQAARHTRTMMFLQLPGEAIVPFLKSSRVMPSRSVPLRPSLPAYTHMHVLCRLSYRPAPHKTRIALWLHAWQTILGNKGRATYLLQPEA